jgi:hypothetical protein
VDDRQMRRWQIDRRLLPPDAVLLYAPSSFYEDHEELIWGVASFIGLQAVVIGALIVNIVRRRQVEGKLATQADELAVSNADLQRLRFARQTGAIGARRQSPEPGI